MTPLTKRVGSTIDKMALRKPQPWIQALSLAAILFVMPIATMRAQGQSSANEPKAVMNAQDLSLSHLQAIPEPATYMLLGFGILVCAQQFRKGRK